MPGGALEVIDAGALDGVDRDLRPALRPERSTSARSACAWARITGAADALDVRLTGRGGHTSRPHLTEDLTFALAKVVTEVPAVLSPPARPARRRQRGLGQRPRRLAPRNVIPATGARRRHGADARRRRLGRRARQLVRELVERDRRAVRRGGRRSTTAAACRRWSTSRRPTALLGRGGRARCSATDGRSSHHAEPRRRGLRAGTSTRPRRDGPARHPHARAARRTTCTRATCASTSGPSAIGAKVLADASPCDAAGRRPLGTTRLVTTR